MRIRHAVTEQFFCWKGCRKKWQLLVSVMFLTVGLEATPLRVRAYCGAHSGLRSTKLSNRVIISATLTPNVAFYTEPVAPPAPNRVYVHNLPWELTNEVSEQLLCSAIFSY